MTDDRKIEELIAKMTRGEPIDWDAAWNRATTDEGRARLEALRGIDQIAAFNHAEWERFAPLLAHLREMESDGPAPESPTPPLAGATIGAYTLESPLGVGGMGEVWLARRSDGRFEGRAAIKLLRPPLAGSEGLARFEREGRILARLRHGNIAQLLDAGVTPTGQPYLLLEHVAGVAIDRYCDQHALEVRARVELFLAVLDAVAHAQANLVLHRDLKPSNILVDTSGTVKLLDFGVGKLLEESSGATAVAGPTTSLGRALTPEFAAPEQLRGDPVTTATDVYSAGVVLYLLLTRRHPAGDVRDAPLKRMQAILESEPRPASEVVVESSVTARTRRELQGDLERILAKALKKDPRERYENAAAFAADLRRFLNREPVTARDDTVRYRVGKFVRRHRTSVVSSCLVFVALAALTIFAMAELIEVRHQRDEVRAQMQLAEGFNTVVTSVLSQTGPGGRALSPEELLDRAVDEVQARYADNPGFLVDMLIRISGRYFDLGDHNQEYATLVRAEEIARQTGDPSLIFLVQSNTVETELYLGRRREAHRRLEEATRLLPELRPPPPLVAYQRAAAQLAEADGDFPAAIVYLERARQEMESTGDIHGNSYAGLLSVLRLCHFLAGELREAHRNALEMVEVHRRHHRENSVAGMISRGVLAMSCGDLGQVARSRVMLEEVFPELTHPDTAEPGLWLVFGWTYGERLGRLGQGERALPLIRASLDMVISGGNRMNETRARLALARTLLQVGRLKEARGERRHGRDLGGRPTRRPIGSGLSRRIGCGLSSTCAGSSSIARSWRPLRPSGGSASPRP